MRPCPGSVHEKTVSSSCARNRLEATPDIGATSQVRPVMHIDAYAVNQALSDSALRRAIESLEDCETRAYILVDVRTSLASGRPAVSAVRSACVRAVAKELGEMPALSHIGSGNPGDAATADSG